MFQQSQVELLADKNGGLMRLLGVEIGAPDSTNEPRCQRFACIVEDGILLKLVRNLKRKKSGKSHLINCNFCRGWSKGLLSSKFRMPRAC